MQKTSQVRKPKAMPAKPDGTIGEADLNEIAGSGVDRLTRSLADFAKLVELFDQHLDAASLVRPPTSLRACKRSPHLRFQPPCTPL